MPPSFESSGSRLRISLMYPSGWTESVNAATTSTTTNHHSLLWMVLRISRFRKIAIFVVVISLLMFPHFSSWRPWEIEGNRGTPQIEGHNTYFSFLLLPAFFLRFKERAGGSGVFFKHYLHSPKAILSSYTMRINFNLRTYQKVAFLITNRNAPLRI